MTREEGRKLIAERVEDFERNKVVLTKKGHGETNIRSNYIDKLFEALGWNMTNVYEIVREYSQRDRSVAAGMKKVDYAFKLNGKLKFFIEAKEASVNLETDKDAIYQAKRYAYSSNGRAPIVILTDFEEFRVFNVMKAPAYDNSDRELLRNHSMRYTDYVEKWDILWDAFSREAVEGGSLDRLRGKIDKNTKTMDADFLDAITKWRETLAKNIANRNDNLNVQEINEAVQRILDRLIFIRNLEDREIEPENTLLDARKKEDIYRTTLLPLFRSLDKTYNGLLFKRHFSEDIIIDDKTLKEIIREMCYPVSPFQFDIIEPEILGRVYEKFLGSKIRLTEGHRVKIEEKMEVRKAGGVYYTPEYIVEYIVNNTVGKKIEGMTPDGIKSIKILDPACGSGSFLLGAYTCLLEYHRKWYAKHQQDKAYKNDWYLTSEGELKVRLDKRADILRNNIFGVDIDHEATEVSIMSLYLKMLDDGFDKGQQDLFFAKGSILPDMSENIKCGNSLVGSDYFDGKLDIDLEELRTIKPFDWDAEGTYNKDTKTWIGRGFPEIMKNGGFDCVIGNPPYLYSAGKDNIDYYKKYYSFSQYQTDFYVFFIEKGLRILRIDGVFSFIVPDSWLNSVYFLKMRNSLLQSVRINSITAFDYYVFNGVSLENTIFNITKNEKIDCIEIHKFFGEDKFGLINCLDPKECVRQEIINLYQNKCTDDIIKKIEFGSQPLSQYLIVNRGLHAYRTDGYGKSKYVNGFQIQKDKEEKSYHALEKVDQTYLPEIKGKNIFSYDYESTGMFLSYGNWLAEPRTPEFFMNPKIVLRKILGNRIVGTFIEEPAAIDQSIYICIDENNDSEKLKTILAVLASDIGSWYLKNKYSIFDALYPWYTKKQLDAFPIKYDPVLAGLVSQMIQLSGELKIAKSETDKEIISKKKIMIDNKINDQVHKMYNLTDEEIKIIEESSNP